MFQIFLFIKVVKTKHPHALRKKHRQAEETARQFTPLGFPASLPNHCARSFPPLLPQFFLRRWSP